jgi:hypothetical protein
MMARRSGGRRRRRKKRRRRDGLRALPVRAEDAPVNVHQSRREPFHVLPRRSDRHVEILRHPLPTVRLDRDAAYSDVLDLVTTERAEQLQRIEVGRLGHWRAVGRLTASARPERS